MVVAQRVLDEVVAEFEASCAGRLKLLAHRTEVAGGALEACGSHADSTRWTGAYVRSDRAVLPLSAGERDRVVLECVRHKRAGTPLWNPAKYPPPQVVVDGRAYFFAPGHGRLLIGQVRLERRAVLLAAIGDALAVIHIAGRVRSVLHVGKPHSFRELDVDQLLRLQGRRGPKPQHAALTGPVRPPPPVEAEHRRIVHGLAVEVGTGPTIAQVLGACFEDVADRARALKASVATRMKEKLEATADVTRRLAARRVRGKSWARPVLRYLCKLAIRGHGNIVGRVGEIIAMFRENFPSFALTAEALSDVLGLLQALGTCLINPRADGERIWEINLAGLTDPRSALHRRLCRETKGRRLVDVAAMGEGGDPENTSDIPPTPPPAGGSFTAGVDAVEAPLEIPPDAIDIAAILEALCGLPPEAGSALLAATLKSGPPEAAEAETAPSAPERADADDPATAAPPEHAGSATTASRVGEAPPEHAGSATTASRVGEAAAAAPERGQVDATPPEASDLTTAAFDVLDELRRLPPVAARTLLLGSRVYRKRLETAATDDENTATGDPAPLLQQKRRRLHLSPDHTLVLPRVAVVAEVPGAGRSSNKARDVVLGPRPPGARGPPKSIT